MHIELTEMLRCPEPHAESFLVLSTGEMLGRMVRSGILGCPVCRREYPIIRGVVWFSPAAPAVPGPMRVEPAAPAAPAAPPRSLGPVPRVDAQTLQALLDLSGPGGYVVLVGSAARHAVGLAGLMGGVHFVGVDAPPDSEELPVLSLLAGVALVPLRASMARGVVVGVERAAAPWLAEAHRVLLRGRRLVVEDEQAIAPDGATRLAAAQGLWVGEKR